MEAAKPSAKVYTAIQSVMADLSKEGIAKDRRNSGQGYQFRGIDDVYNCLAPILSRNGLMMLPRILNRTSKTEPTKGGGQLNYVIVEAEFDLVASEDGSRHTIRTFGEAMDMADKATNKAMSAAFKYAAMQAFCIPTEGDNDADGSHPEPGANPPAKAPANPPANRPAAPQNQPPAPPTQQKKPWRPKDAADLYAALRRKEGDLVAAKACEPRALINLFEDEVANFPADLADWTPEHVSSAYDIAVRIMQDNRW
jgi:ERF superfamily